MTENYRKYLPFMVSVYEGGSMATVCAQSYIVDVLCATVYKDLGAESDERNMKVALTISDKAI